MSKLNGRKVKLGRIHEVIHVMGAGQIGPLIDADVFKAKGRGSATLIKVEEGVLLTIGAQEVLIPDTMFKTIEFEPEVTTPVAKK